MHKIAIGRTPNAAKEKYATIEMLQNAELDKYIMSFEDLYFAYVNQPTQKNKVTNIFKGWFSMTNPERILPMDEAFLNDVEKLVCNLDCELQKFNNSELKNSYSASALKIMLINREEKMPESVQMYIMAAQSIGIPLVKHLNADTKLICRQIMIQKTKKSLLLPNQKKMFKALNNN